ncbi:MAG: DUF1580 domain-containing protein [Planctomycetia bacterium]|nr:DUF1580 domain-containing protein [Planctomycetia bacterium]
MRSFLPFASRLKWFRPTSRRNQMIDLTTESLLTLNEASALLPDRPSVCTLWRWRTKGARGRRLETIALSGKIYTSIEALSRFAEQQGGDNQPTIRTPAARERAIAQAEKELERAGI